MILWHLAESELVEDAPDVTLDRAERDYELCGDSGVRASVGHQR